jgi:hypothetical protein
MLIPDTDATWQSWFAWRPVYLGNKLSKDGRAGKLGTVWLESLERRRAGAYEGGGVSSGKRLTYRAAGSSASR